jgi:predicted lipoprotein with Yx(FWY)xxD motif
MKLAVVAASLTAGWSLVACGSSDNASSGSTVPDGLATQLVHLDTAYVANLHATVLVTAGGFVVYIFAPDNRRAVTCTGTCALTWPPLTVANGTRPDLGAGIEAGLVGTITAPGGAKVLTYNRWPLYSYVSDVQPGMDSGQGINLNGGAWYVLRPDGTPIIPSGQPAL